MSDNRVILPPGDDISEEVVTPIGFPFGGVIHHDIHVSYDIMLCNIIFAQRLAGYTIYLCNRGPTTESMLSFF